jgi:hypothetical protein
MPSRSAVRLPVLFATLAFLAIVSALLIYNRPARLVSEERAGNAAAPASAGDEKPASEKAGIQPAFPSPQPSPSAPIVALRMQAPEPDTLYRALQESADPQEKRRIRRQLATLKPGEIPFRFALAKYAEANNEEEKLHLLSVVAQIDVSDFPNEVALTASTTKDESLFVSLAYALRNSTNIVAKQELLALAANNQLPSVRTNSLMSNQGLVALHRCLLDSLKPSDLVWIEDFITTNSLNAVQQRIVSDFITKTKRR